MKQCMKGFRTAFAVLGCFLAFSSVRAEESFTFNDIHYWVGTGTNRAAVVIDWNNGKPNSSLAWGIRWNGAAPSVATLLGRLVDEDHRLHVGLSHESWGTWILGFAYDANNNGGAFDIARGRASDDNDFINIDDFSSDYYWTVVRSVATTLTNNTTWAYGNGADYLYPVNGDWFACKRINWTVNEGFVPAVPVFAESPYAHRVVACQVETGDYSDPSTVLGAPSTVTKGYPPYSSDAPVTPCNPAFSPDQLLTLAKTEAEADGFVVVAFDHPVVDDPLNPYGLDFIVFGNAFHPLGGGPYFSETEDPNLYKFFSPSVRSEPGLVQVSQDGITWFSFVDGPFADDFAPTMSHLYDTNSPDASLFAGNKWWGAKTNPTLPLDPRLTAADFVERTLAEYATLYNGSAGGTGFDIGGFDLPVDPVTGRKWIQYVRVTSKAMYDPDEDSEWTEIDAFADVAPALPYDNWVRDNYAWTQLPDTNIVGKSVIAANGKPNFYNAAFGTAPDAAAVENFAISSFTVADGKAIFRVPSAKFAFDAFRIGKASTVNGLYRNSLPTYEETLLTETGFESVFSVPVDSAATNAFYKIELSH